MEMKKIHLSKSFKSKARTVKLNVMLVNQIGVFKVVLEIPFSLLKTFHMSFQCLHDNFKYACVTVIVTKIKHFSSLVSPFLKSRQNVSL